jgi:putative endonuclease
LAKLALKIQLAKHNTIGFNGETLAQRYLTSKGYNILATNWRLQKFEIDIIAEYINELIIVEVKTRSTRHFGEAQQMVSPKKQFHLIEGAQAYIENNNINLPCRFDIISVYPNENNTIEHFENAFGPEW